MTATDQGAGAPVRSEKPFRLWPPLLFASAVGTSAYVWWTVALPVLSGRMDGHEDHAWPLYAHAVGGTLMLLAGSAALFIGWTKAGFAFHRPLGAVYLLGGAVASLLAIGLNVLDPHDDFGIGLATGTLAAVWLAVAAMALRAILNGRVDSHREWMIRSYVLTWTFVFCRMVQRTDAVAALGEGAVAHVIWTTWIVPLVVCELVLQWRKGTRAAAS